MKHTAKITIYLFFLVPIKYCNVDAESASASTLTLLHDGSVHQIPRTDRERKPLSSLNINFDLPSIPNLLKERPIRTFHPPNINLNLPLLPNIVGKSILDLRKNFQSSIDRKRSWLRARNKCQGSSVDHAVQVSGGAVKKRRRNNTGSYYGICDDVFFPDRDERSTGRGSKRKEKEEDATSKALADIMGETLYELREMREDISALREEMQSLKGQFGGDKSYLDYESGDIDDEDETALDEEDSYDENDMLNRPNIPQHSQRHVGVGSYVWRLKRQREFEAIGQDIENWAHYILFEEEQDVGDTGWKEIQCNKIVRKKFNKNGNTTCYLKWMHDQRGKHARDDDDGQKYPCIKCYATINAPLEKVCSYLADESRVQEYNDLVIAHRDLEEIAPRSKICWGQCPQILFIKSRDFVTFCHHRWKNDGTQVVVNQACEHEDAPGCDDESDGKVCRAMALRGANFISRDPDDPNKTRYALLAHADPGGGIPTWAMKTAINAVAPIEPFKLFARIEQNVLESIRSEKPQAEMMKSSDASGSRPAGLSQMGYACFWPKSTNISSENKVSTEKSQQRYLSDRNKNSNGESHLEMVGCDATASGQIPQAI